MSRVALRAVCAVVMSCTVPAPVFAADLLVPSEYPTIQAAIDAAVTGDTVLVASGTYYGQVDLKGKLIALRSASGNEVTSLRPPLGSTVGILKCVTGETADCIIEGFTISGALNGPGVQIVGASPVFRSCKITNNTHSAANGAGVAFTGTGGSPLFEDCFFFGNFASGREGGAISAAATGATLTCRRCEFVANQVTASYGGAVHATTVAATFEDCVFEDNFVYAAGGFRQGGALYSTAPLTVTSCRFDRNWVRSENVYGSQSALGGAIAARGGLALASSQFTANRAESGEGLDGALGRGAAGAVYLFSTAPASIEGCFFEANRAIQFYPGGQARDAVGGACAFEGGCDPAIDSCEFISNRAESTGGGYGGTLYFDDLSDGFVRDCSITGSFAQTDGGAVWLEPTTGPAFERTTFISCTAQTSGGAVRVSTSGLVPLFTDCRFSQCSSANGGAVWIDSVRPYFDRCVFDQNTSNNGSAIRAQGTGVLNIPSICYSHFCGNSGASTNWISGNFYDPHPDAPTNTLEATCSADCNTNGIDDLVEISVGLAGDCDLNDVPDDCQADCNGNGTPDVCEIAAGAGDCDGNGVPDACEIASGVASDANLDGIPDACQPEVTFTGLVTEIVPITDAGTGLPTGAVCWRVYAAFSQPASTVLLITGDAIDPLEISASGGFWQAAGNFDPVFPTLIPCVATPAALKYDSFLTIGADCGSGTAPATQIGLDYADFASTGGPIGMLDPANGAAVYTTIGVEAGESGRVLLMQLTTNTPDRPVGRFNVIGETPTKSGDVEWSAFGVTIPEPALIDCNGNGTHDGLDIASGAATDCDLNGVPDSCEWAGALADCDGDGISDFCEIAAGASDSNGNGTPDECECVGDVTGDGAVNVDDIVEVIVAWGDSVIGGPDLDGDGVVGADDLSLVLDNWGSCTPLDPPVG